jgi:hypothetical protein
MKRRRPSAVVGRGGGGAGEPSCPCGAGAWRSAFPSRGLDLAPTGTALAITLLSPVPLRRRRRGGWSATRLSVRRLEPGHPPGALTRRAWVPRRLAARVAARDKLDYERLNRNPFDVRNRARHEYVVSHRPFKYVEARARRAANSVTDQHLMWIGPSAQLGRHRQVRSPLQTAGPPARTARADRADVTPVAEHPDLMEGRRRIGSRRRCPHGRSAPAKGPRRRRLRVYCEKGSAGCRQRRAPSCSAMRLFLAHQ